MTNDLITRFGFIRVAAAAPPMRIADIGYNTKQILDFAKKAEDMGVAVTVFPEQSITGYTLGDLFHQRALLDKTLVALKAVRDASKKIKSVLVVGLPLEYENKLFNVAAVIAGGKVYGIVPKTYIPGYKEFYEERWFSSARDLSGKEIKLFDSTVPIGTDLLFPISGFKDAVLGIEICEDLWVPVPPSSLQVLKGATVIANPSASNDLVGKADYRKGLVIQQSARGICGYVYASCGPHESTTDLAFGGHAIIAENGSELAESRRFDRNGELSVSKLDTEHIIGDREKMTSFGEGAHEIPLRNFRHIEITLQPKKLKEVLFRNVDAYPFVPQNPVERDKRAEEIFSIQTAGLAKRLENSGLKKLILGISGGLDSTLALLVSVRACGLLNIPLKNIFAVTMPGPATSGRTRANAVKLAESLGVSLESVDISRGALQHLKEIGHDAKTQNVTYQNAQARYRTMILMNKANQIGALVVGTGDLSEIALGWNTYTGDHISHYNVNAGVPKTLVRYLIQWISERKEFKGAKNILEDILRTPISPELARTRNKEITQKTEELIGPYELHDFFLYHFVRWSSSPRKILFLAGKAFGTKYADNEIKKWLRVFLTRFFKNQWKRSVMPDGPKVGSVALSPRGDWRMPSDAEVNLWLKELDS